MPNRPHGKECIKGHMPEFVMPKHHLDFDFGFRSDCLDYKKNL